MRFYLFNRIFLIEIANQFEYCFFYVVKSVVYRKGELFCVALDCHSIASNTSQ